MQKLISPFCLFLALAMLIAGFAVWSVEGPEAGIELHQARVSGDEDYEQALEAALERRKTARFLLIGGLFGGSVLMTAGAFLSLRT
jgi:hypothetical protein